MSEDYGLTSATLAADNLIAGGFPIVEKGITLVEGQNLTRGTVLGRITTGGKFTAYDADVDPVDGSEKPVAILARDTDATDADVKTTAYFTGVFNAAAVTGEDAAGILLLEARGIHIV